MGLRSKILIVDDEPFNVDYLEQELEDLGYDTISAVNGQDALEKIFAETPDLILLDVMMPVLDGFRVCRILKENEETRLIPIVMMTALNAMDDRIKGIEAGADEFLTKPVNEGELLARIRTALRLKHTVDRKIGELRQVKDHFAKFVPEAVKRLVAVDPAAPGLARKHERDVTVLFLDISGYSRLSERLPLKMLETLVERYFSAFLDQIDETGGDINETAGDGFMATFQAMDRHVHAIKAVDAALALLATTEVLNRENECPVAIHIGLNSGRALVGATRLEGQRRSRWTFTASGAVTNVAARLAGVAEAGQILIGPETVRRLGGRYRLERVGREHLKNIVEAVDIHRVLGRSAPAP
jgi:DNA-binding response OmpR family regulator